MNMKFILTLVFLFMLCFGACYNTFIYNKITHCVIKSNKCLNNITKNTRGKKYWLTNNNNNCFITTWHIYHLVQYFFLGFFFPSYHLELVGIGIIFELLEKYFFECDDLMDIIFNIVGLYMGVYANYIFK